jgi:acyl dehydratase
VADKKIGVLLTKEMKCIDSKGELVAILTSTIFIKELGGFGDKGTIHLQYPKKPSR